MIDTRISRCSKADMRDWISAAFQQVHILRLYRDAVSLDATYIKAHPDGAGAIKKANKRVESPTANGAANGIWLVQMRERSYRFFIT